MGYIPVCSSFDDEIYLLKNLPLSKLKKFIDEITKRFSFPKGEKMGVNGPAEGGGGGMGMANSNFLSLIVRHIWRYGYTWPYTEGEPLWTLIVHGVCYI